MMLKLGKRKQLASLLVAALLCSLPWVSVQAAKKNVILAPTASVAELQEVLSLESQHPQEQEPTYQQFLIHPARERGYLWRDEGSGTGGLPRRFRTEQYPLAKAAWIPSREGLAALRVSGSANPGRNEFKPLLQTLRTAAGRGPVYIVDLRQESHGYLNNESVSWYGKDNRSNVGLSTAAILQDEAQRLTAAQGKTVTATTFGRGKPQGNKTFTVSSTETEAAAVRAAGGHYVRFTLTDMLAPQPNQVDAFLKFYKHLPPDAWLHFHCQAGMGRTTTFMTMADILRNADRVAVEDIAARQYLLKGVNLLEGGKKDSDDWHELAAVDRARFIKYFYDYVQAYPKLNKSWSSWLTAKLAQGEKQAS
jgi:hypothetical protein